MSDKELKYEPRARGRGLDVDGSSPPSVSLGEERAFSSDTQTHSNLYKRHYRGAWVRSISALIMGTFVLPANLIGLVRTEQAIGIGCAILFLILIGPPSLFLIKRYGSRRSIKIISLAVNFLETLGYTAVMFFLGGLEAAYLLPIYGILIAYVGMVGPHRYPFVVATFCAFWFSLMVVAEIWGWLPYLGMGLTPFYPVDHRVMILAAIIGLLYVSAFASSYTAGLLKKNREVIRSQNNELQQVNALLNRELDRRIEMEGLLRRTNETLEQRVQERTEELEIARVKAEIASQAKSEFLSNMSHELRTPLNHIIGFSELLSDKHFGPLNANQEEYLSDILQSSRYLLSLVNDILDLSKIEAGKMAMEFTDVFVPRLVEDSLNLIQNTALDRRIRIRSQTGKIPSILRADERKLKQVLSNLLFNALKFTPEGGNIHLETRSWNGQGVEFIVADNGIGLAQSDLERIFLDFEQGDVSTSKKFQGTGLGLAISKRLVKLHGGRIWAESEGLGKGSAFHFVVPQAMDDRGTGVI